MGFFSFVIYIIMEFKKWLLSERTLYHGTVVDNEESIRKYGLQGGWHGPLGSYVAQGYDDEGYGEPTEDDEVVFLADRKNLGNSVSGMVHHIGVKLGKDFHAVSDNDIRNHGLLVIVKDSDIKPYSAYDRSWAYRNVPRGAEEGDYMTPSTGADIFLKGAALLRFLTQRGEWPRDWGVGNNRRNQLQGQLISAIMNARPDVSREQVIAKIRGLNDKELSKYLKRYLPNRG
jgi:hypothetical protein